MPGRAWSDASRNYRFGFNGKEKDFETSNDNYDFGARIYDGRLGRWLSLDPHWYNYPDLSPFNFGLNDPLGVIDPDGKDVIFKKGNGVTGYQHRKMKYQILLMRIFSSNFRIMYRDFKNSDKVYSFNSSNGEEIDNAYGEFKCDGNTNSIYINMTFSEDILKIRETIAHESGHAWRSHHGLQYPFESKPLPTTPSRNFGESIADYNKRYESYKKDYNKIDSENKINASKWKRESELSANHIQNIVMSDLNRSLFFKRSKPETKYGPVLIYTKINSINGNSYQGSIGYFNGDYGEQYYESKKDIRNEFGLFSISTKKIVKFIIQARKNGYKVK